VIAAAGSGERLGAGGPKALVPLAGRPLIEWALEAFEAAARVEQVIVAMPAGYEAQLPVLSVTGGASRSASVLAALVHVATELVVVHDAARPLVTPELIDATLASLAGDAEAAGAVAAAPLTDTVKEAGGRPPVVERTLDRERLWAVQTPQAFRTAALREALEGASPGELASATDDAALVEARGGRVLICPAAPENFKVTTKLDLRIAEALLAERAEG